jgi:hypothetical protein
LKLDVLFLMFSTLIPVSSSSKKEHQPQPVLSGQKEKPVGG